MVAKGNLNINLHTGFKHSQVVVKGDPRDLEHLHTTVINGTLMIKFDNFYPHYSKVTADINTRRFDTFVFKGSGMIKGHNLQTNNLNIFIKNDQKNYLQGNLRLRRVTLQNGYTELIGVNSPGMTLKLSEKARVKIVGKANVAALEVTDDSLLSMYWIKSKSLIIRANKGVMMQLAGVVDKLDLELWGQSRFMGRYLRANQAFIKTHDHSVVEISVVDKQHTLASDSSDIRFYNIPTFKSDFMAFDGAVLDMRDLASPFVEEYTPYNK